MPSREEAQAASPTSDALATSRSLLDCARLRDGPAWERLVALYAPLVYFWCRRAQLAEQDIPDVVQEVFRAVVVGIDTFRKERPGDSFRGWLRTVTRSKLSDYFRRQRRNALAVGGSDLAHRLNQVPGEPLEDDDPQEESAEQALFFRGLEAIRGQFEPRTWDAFWRVVVDQQSVAEVAHALAMRPGTVRVAKCRVLQRLRQQLGDVE
jgi:RNA polymerase sigma-70 factor (ECF subfamily)